uniref:Peptidase S74 domain-containing protein n=1 Tax=viral metagenome TaxID=1070528 RepID=A0A6C0KUL2_9ZZZZ
MSNVTYNLLNALPSGGVWKVDTNYLTSDYFKLGINAGQNNQDTSAIAIGYQAGQNNQQAQAVAVGEGAGQESQAQGSVAVGYNCGIQYQYANSVAIGYQAGYQSQGALAIAIGANTAQNSQDLNAIAIGTSAGNYYQSNSAIAIGNGAGYGDTATQSGQGQQISAIAIGNVAGYNFQGSYSIAIGFGAGCTYQFPNSVAIGYQAGYQNQNAQCVGIGYQAGLENQGANSIAIGSGSGVLYQGNESIAIGDSAGYFNQGTNAIAIGQNAGYSNQNKNTIILNATGNTLNSQTQYACYVAPIRQTSALNTLGYDATTKELVYQGNPITEALNFSNYGQTTKLQSITYTDNTVVKTSGINANLDSSIIYNAQTYTFGPNLQGRYVAVGNTLSGTNNPALIYSSDGLNWYVSQTPVGVSGNWFCVAYNGTVWVAGGTGSVARIYYSYDGINWTYGYSGNTIYSIAWGKDKFVAGGAGNMFYSYDGINWVSTSNNIFTSVGACRGIAFNGTRWVAVGTNFTATSAPTITGAYSADGITWAATTTNIFGTTIAVSSGYGVAWNGIRWVAVGTNAATPTTTVAYSSDGITWALITGANTFNGSAGGVGRAVAWNGTRFVAVGTNATTTPSVTGITSSDGINWTATTTNIFTTANSATGLSVMWTGTKWIAGGSGATGNINMLYSYDGLLWNSVVTSPYNATSCACYGIAYNSVRPNQMTFPRNISVLGCSNTTTIGGPTGTLGYSLDNGINWTTTTNQLTGGVTVFGSGSCFCSKYNGYMWIAGGTWNSTNSNNMAYSYDGINWTVITNTPITGINSFIKSIVWNKNLKQWNACGMNSNGSPAIQYSYDGFTWYLGTITITSAIPSSSLFIGTISTTTLTFSSIQTGSGPITVGQQIVGLNINQPCYITAFGTGTGGAGTYTVSSSQTVSSATNISGLQPTKAVFNCTFTSATVMVVTSVTSGALTIGQTILGGSIGSNCIITSLVSGTFGGAGTYNITNSGTTSPISGAIAFFSISSSFTATISTTVLTVSAVTSGRLTIGQLITGTNVSASTVIVSFGTGTGGAGTYNISVSQTISSATTMSGNFPSTFTNVSCSKYGYVACSNGSTKLLFSFDGKTWIESNTTPFPISALSSLWNGTIWVAVGSGNSTDTQSTAYSSDGVSWTLSTSNAMSNTSATQYSGIAWNGLLWIVCGTAWNNTTTQCVYYSYDGINWTSTTTSLLFSATSVSWLGNRFILSRYSSSTLTIYYSPDGLTWTPVTGLIGSQSFGFTYVSSWCENIPNTAIQQPTLAFGSGTNSIAYSQDGIIWRGLGSTLFTTGYDACWNGNLWLAVGTGYYALAYSYDGINWFGITNSLIDTGTGVAWNGTLFVVVGSFSSLPVVIYSYDGFNWSQSAMASGNFPSSINCIAWGQNYFVLGGDAGNLNGYNCMAYSTDGITWTGLGIIFTISNNSAGGCNKIICGGNIWVAVGINGVIDNYNSQIFYANDPTLNANWISAFTGDNGTQLLDVTFGTYPVSSSSSGTTYGTIYLAIGSGGSVTTVAYYYSTNGTTWSLAFSSSATPTSAAIAFNGKRFVSGFSNSSFYYSYSGTSASVWYTAGTSSLSQLFTTSINAIVANPWPTIGSVYTDNALTTSGSSGINLNNQLDVYSDTYFNNGYNNMAVTIKSNTIP